ncbi:hypothetical protein [Plantactinospora sp. KLBMP9567]|uniref:hypothetical protein n=1 Tax=Plantactinospora sp. KLBMP9567 TaxID=3085900 RepID=UPI0029820572|nr:hypothetical protein [Plantactinospora sp. KLBMP9567]MDW5327105.1 hypothetical protein [Plantactinospora sp. KLBMP9567]
MTAEVEDRTGAVAAPMTSAQIRRAMSGLSIGIFVAILSSTIVSLRRLAVCPPQVPVRTECHVFK